MSPLHSNSSARPSPSPETETHTVPGMARHIVQFGADAAGDPDRQKYPFITPAIPRLLNPHPTTSSTFTLQVQFHPARIPRGAQGQSQPKPPQPSGVPQVYLGVPLGYLHTRVIPLPSPGRTETRAAIVSGPSTQWFPTPCVAPLLRSAHAPPRPCWGGLRC